IDVSELARLKEQGAGVCDYPEGRKLERDAIIDVECDIWIPAARPDVIREDNVDRLKTKLLLEGANIPLTAGAEDALYRRGVLCVPDFIANAGGVICAAMEYAGATQSAVFQSIEEKIRTNVESVLGIAVERQTPPRQAAVQLATERVREAMKSRRFNIM
ncbi:MAG: Glu/Leu/Phe/Val dehydrogenase, partial [Dehalococcoidia bacterium]|nr:Glu/Leu/Phe/Val dehydrogenase [Dehalococcoidia bacterium]